jgi:hypothetical protein
MRLINLEAARSNDLVYVTFRVTGNSGRSDGMPHFAGYPPSPFTYGERRFRVNSECPPLTQEETDFLKAYLRLVS